MKSSYLFRFLARFLTTLMTLMARNMFQVEYISLSENTFNNFIIVVTRKRPKRYLTKYRKKVKNYEERAKKKETFEKALKDCARGRFSSVKKCAAYHKVAYSTLYTLFTRGEEYKGSGGANKVLSVEEEASIVAHVKWRASVGCGITWFQLTSLIQEILIALTTSNPERQTGFEKTGQLPNINFVRRLAERHNLSLRRTAEISKGKSRHE